MSDIKVIINNLDKRYNDLFISYLYKINKFIYSTLSTPYKNKNINFDILDSDDILNTKLLCLKMKHTQMKIGTIWQYVLGNYYNYQDLTIGHETGLDIINRTDKIIIELKNRTNTDNCSAKKTNFDKLSKFKKINPKYLCIYGCINENDKDKTLSGSIKKIIHNNEEIYMYTGYQLLKLILKENCDIIIKHIQNIFNDYYHSY